MFARLTARFGIYGLLVVACLGWGQVGKAQKQPGDEAPALRPAPIAENGTNFILRTYEVGDLVINIEDRPFSNSLQRMSGGGGGFGGGGMGGGQFGGGGGGFFSVPGEAHGAAHTPNGARGRSIGQSDSPRAARIFQLAQFGGGGAEMASDDARPSASITIPDLVRVITSTVAENTWTVNGGGDGQIEPLGTTLVVWQDAEVHKRISELLEQLRKGSADRGTVTVDARWLLLTSDEIDGLILPNQKGVPQVDREQLEKLTRRAGSLRGVTSCLSSQLVYIVSGTMKNIVSGYIPVVGSIDSPNRGVQLAGGAGARIQLVSETGLGMANPRAVGYQPIVQTANFGALLEIRPTLTPLSSEAPVVVDLKSTVTIDGEKRNEGDPIVASDKIAPAVDRVAIETLEFATTLRMPLKKPVLVGGLTYIPSSARAGDSKDAAEAGGEGEAAERPQLYLVLEVR